MRKLDPDDVYFGVAVSGSANTLIDACHGLAQQAGWWTDLKTGQPVKKPVPEALMLMVSELGEAMEGHRKGLMDDKLPHRTMLEVEIADLVIRAFDFAGGYNLDLAGAIVEKLQFNARRADHKPENRVLPGGKQY